jgi:Holliday junction resolvase RusA-like endonuclease
MTEILFTCVIPGRPGILKNSKQICRTRSGKTFLKASDKYAIWEHMALAHVKAQGQEQQINFPVNLACKFYFTNKKWEPDLDNCYAGVQDVLQKAGVLLDDSWIWAHDGSRKIFGARADRVEVTVTRFLDEDAELVGRDH